MTSGGQKFVWMLAGAMFIALGSASAQPTTRGSRPIIFSDTKSGDTNQPAVTRRLSLDVLENNVKKPLEIFDFADPARGQPQVVMPPPPPQINSQQVKKLLEKRDWVFRSPDDYKKDAGLSADDIFKAPQLTPTGKSKDSLSPLERYIDRQEQARANAGTNGIGSDTSLFGKSGGSDDYWLDPRRGRTENLGTPAEQALKRMTESRTALFEGESRPRNVGDFFGVTKVEDPLAARTEHNQRLENFKKLLEPPAPVIAPGVNPPVAGPMTLPGLPKTPTAFPGGLPNATARRDSFTPFSSPVGSSFSSSLGVPGSSPTLGVSAVQPAKVESTPLISAPPTFAVPKRKF